MTFVFCSHLFHSYDINSTSMACNNLLEVLNKDSIYIPQASVPLRPRGQVRPVSWPEPIVYP